MDVLPTANFLINVKNLGATRHILRQTDMKMKKLIAFLGVCLFCISAFADSPAYSVERAWVPPPRLRVVVIPSKTEVRVKEQFKVGLRVENPTATNQIVRVWSCSWDEEWKSSNTNIYFGGWDCTKNAAYDLTIPPGGAYTNELEMLILEPFSEKTLSFRMGFTPIDSKQTFWSDKVKLKIISSDK